LRRVRRSVIGLETEHELRGLIREFIRAVET